MTTEPERHLLHQLLHSGQSRGHNGHLRRTAAEFVVEYGWWYTPAPPPKRLRQGEPNQCFKNAFLLAFENPDLTYVEGYAVLDGGLKVAHAWVTDGSGNALDTTWPIPGVAYAGVPFSRDFVNANFVVNEAVVCLIDDYLNDWPLLTKLADKPGLWLEEAGRGREKVRQEQG